MKKIGLLCLCINFMVISTYNCHQAFADNMVIVNNNPIIFHTDIDVIDSKDPRITTISNYANKIHSKVFIVVNSEKGLRFAYKLSNVFLSNGINVQIELNSSALSKSSRSDEVKLYLSKS